MSTGAEQRLYSVSGGLVFGYTGATLTDSSPAAGGEYLVGT